MVQENQPYQNQMVETCCTRFLFLVQGCSPISLMGSWVSIYFISRFMDVHSFQFRSEYRAWKILEFGMTRVCTSLCVYVFWIWKPLIYRCLFIIVCVEFEGWSKNMKTTLQFLVFLMCTMKRRVCVYVCLCVWERERRCTLLGGEVGFLFYFIL